MTEFIDHSPLMLGRSPGWLAVRDTHLVQHPYCAACGRRDDLTAHHLTPVHVCPEKELDPKNLLTMCGRCHLLIGHLNDWRSWNTNAVTMAALMIFAIRHRPYLRGVSEVLHAYPSSLNQEAVLIVARGLLGTVDLETVHAAWDLAGFALSQVDPHAPTPPVIGAVPLTRASATEFLTSLQAKGTADATSVDWSKIMEVLLLVLELFRKKS